MFFAAIGDIRGNFSAFEAVLEAIDEAGIHQIVHTGNMAAGGSGGPDVVRSLREREVICVQGAEDRDVMRVERKGATLRKRLGDDTFQTLLSAYDALPGEAIEWLGKVKRSRLITLEGHRVCICHGAPSNASLRLESDTPEDRLLREREVDAPDIVVAGGGSEAFSRHVGGTFFVGTGPMVDEDGEVAYTLINTESKPWTAQRCPISKAG